MAKDESCFASWIERDQEVLFLTAEDIESTHGRKTLEGCLGNDLLGHIAIRKFYNDFKNGINQQNLRFWDGQLTPWDSRDAQLPQSMKDAWNQGKLDGKIQYMTDNDLEHMISHAPIEFTQWAIKHKYPNYKTMKNSKYPEIRMMGLVATQDYKTMKKDPFSFVRMTGIIATKDYKAIKEDPFWNAFWFVWARGQTANNDFKTLKEDLNDYRARIIRLTATEDYKAMKKDKDSFIRLVGLTVTKDYESMKKDKANYIRIIGLIATQDYKAVTRPKL